MNAEACRVTPRRVIVGSIVVLAGICVWFMSVGMAPVKGVAVMFSMLGEVDGDASGRYIVDCSKVGYILTRGRRNDGRDGGQVIKLSQVTVRT